MPYNKPEKNSDKREEKSRSASVNFWEEKE